MLIVIYAANLALAAWDLQLAVLGLYRPNGDGYVHSCFYSLDCLGNAIAGGDPRETISSRAGKAMNNGRVWGCVLCRFLNIFQKDHCLKSIEVNEGQRAIIPDGD
ncbi:hypothetical protein [Burkholderia sp. BE12]|uniref:hypothetical protein n=1 Tax=Burkholderia sp. BE12 TaxID=2082394 RepID=UPI001F43D320|nr:hypothetical protein [Burkholderia sp. BE12]